MKVTYIWASPNLSRVITLGADAALGARYLAAHGGDLQAIEPRAVEPSRAHLHQHARKDICGLCRD